LWTLASSTVHAGYEPPCYIDGCQSADGRFQITAVQSERGRSVHGPHRWDFVWTDTKTGQSRRYAAHGLQDGQIYAQLFLAPDGETFAVWNGITIFSRGQSNMHGPPDLHYKEDSPKWRLREEFSRRLLIYNAKDGSLKKHLGVGDLIREDEWKYVSRQFNRVHFGTPFNGRNHKATPRGHYAWYLVSPDYTVLQLQVGDPKKLRTVSVSLVDGTVYPDGHKFDDVAKTPVKPYQGDDHLPASSPWWLESYTPSLDPVRKAGTYRIDPIENVFKAENEPKKLPDFKTGPVELVAAGYKKADTPSWLNRSGKDPERLLFTDLDASALYALPLGGQKPVELRAGATRGRVWNGRIFCGVIDGKICRWDILSGKEPEVLVSVGHQGGEVSVNDLVVSERGLIYFTTLKDPDKGRLSVVDPATKKVTVLFDGEKEPTLANPNGIALSRGERFLYVGISNYKNLKHSGVYAFPIDSAGLIDVAAGKAKPRIGVPSPDGIAIDREGNVYFTAGDAVHVYNEWARPLAKIKIPKGSGTNLSFGKHDRLKNALYITTNNAVYVVETPVGGP
jgi:sugar lactone lactonase YvrE